MCIKMIMTQRIKKLQCHSLILKSISHFLIHIVIFAVTRKCSKNHTGKHILRNSLKMYLFQTWLIIKICWPNHGIKSRLLVASFPMILLTPHTSTPKRSCNQKNIGALSTTKRKVKGNLSCKNNLLMSPSLCIQKNFQRSQVHQMQLLILPTQRHLMLLRLLNK